MPSHNNLGLRIASKGFLIVREGQSSGEIWLTKNLANGEKRKRGRGEREGVSRVIYNIYIRSIYMEEVLTPFSSPRFFLVS